MALRRIAMCEQAGTGLRMMHREWQDLSHAAPSHDNGKVRTASRWTRGLTERFVKRDVDALQFGVTVADLTNVPRARVSDVPLDKQNIDPIRPGRKPKHHPRSR